MSPQNSLQNGKNQKTLLEYVPEFLEYLDIEKGLSHTTQRTYARFLDVFKKWLKEENLQNIRPFDITEDHIWKYRVFLSKHINKRTRKPLKRNTQNYYLIILRDLFKYFWDRNISTLPAEKIKLTKDENKERTVKFLNLEQLQKLLLAPDVSTKTGLRDRAILETLFSTGVRIAELVSLNRDQFKINENTKDLEVVILGKGNRPRTVYFSERAVKFIKKYLDTRKDSDKALFINYKGPKTRSRRLSPRSVENIVKKYVISAGIPFFTTPHVLRHTYATDLLAQGIDLRTVQEFLGHKNIATTQIYTHVTNKRLRDVHRKFHSGRKLEEE